MENKIETGQIAPNFTLKNQDNNDVTLSDFRGKWVVLFFYPKDRTPGCTFEAQDFSKHLEEFTKLGATVLGVSPDGLTSHCEFIKRSNLKVTLLSDINKEIASTYGAGGIKVFFGKEIKGVKRCTFLIDPHGNVNFHWNRVNVIGHAKQVLAKIKETRFLERTNLV